MTNRTFFASAFCSGLLLATSQAFATVIVSDNFTGATLNAGVVESVLEYGPANASSTHSLSLGTLDGAAMSIGGGSGSIYLTAGLAQTVSLGTVGDFIQANFNFSTTGGANGHRLLRFGFFESGSTDDASVGYYIGGANLNSSGFSNVYVDASTTANSFYTDNGSGGVSGTVAAGTNAAQFRVERTSLTQVTLTGTWAGTVITPIVHTLGASSAVEIDELWFGVRNYG